MAKGSCVKWSKGRTRCLRRSKSGLSGNKAKCPKGRVKSGPRKGMCRKVRRARRK